MSDLVPKSWVRYVLDEYQAETYWNRLAAERGWTYATIPQKPWYTRIRRAFKSGLLEARERLALKLAPWLEQDW